MQKAATEPLLALAFQVAQVFGVVVEGRVGFAVRPKTGDFLLQDVYLVLDVCGLGDE